jgi:branched-chain amino acid transport system permease protein
MRQLPSASVLSWHRGHPAEWLWWLLAVLAFFVLPQYLAIGTLVLIMVLFALSFDLLVGFAGVVTLGHAVFFGIGAYTAGLLALAGWNEPLSGVVIGGAVSALVAAILGPLLLRLTSLPLIMVTLALGAMFFEGASKAVWLTGGDDGLAGIQIAPLFGLFRWGLRGHVKYLYVLGWLLVLTYLARRLIASPFGVTLQGIRENADRMRLLGVPVLLHLVIAYTISAGMAGIAGALLAQTQAFVSLDVFHLELAIDVLVMLVLGGIGSLYGGFIGAPVYMLVRHFAQQWNPFYWMIVIGLLLIVVVRLGRGGLLGAGRQVLARLSSGVSPR